jgi:hypothetical protein
MIHEPGRVGKLVDEVDPSFKVGKELVTACLLLS